MHLFIRAVRRLDTNVFRTLCSLATRDASGFSRITQVHIVSGDGDRDFLAPLARTNAVTIHYGFSETYAKIATWKPKRRAAWSYLFSLQLAIEAQSSALVMEDDVEVCNGWYERLRTAIAFSSQTYPDNNWALSGYYGFPFCPIAKSTRLVEECPDKTFWGNLMTYWPQPALPSIHATFKQTVAKFDDMSTDLTVQGHLKTTGGRLLYTVPSIAQHLGDKTTLRPDGKRRSPMYNDQYEAT